MTIVLLLSDTFALASGTGSSTSMAVPSAAGGTVAAAVAAVLPAPVADPVGRADVDAVPPTSPVSAAFFPFTISSSRSIWKIDTIS